MTSITNLIQNISAKLLAKQWMLVTAESCTGGLVAKLLTDQPGSSAWFERGFVTYSNNSKHDLLKVKTVTLEHHGAISEATVREMAEGALQNSRGQVSLAITGIAGPTGGSPEKPVGSVWFAWSSKEFKTISKLKIFKGHRESIRDQAAEFALEELEKLI